MLSEKFTKIQQNKPNQKKKTRKPAKTQQVTLVASAPRRKSRRKRNGLGVQSHSQATGIGYDRRQTGPKINGRNGNKSFSRISHTEFIMELPGMASATMYQFRVNPADPFTFPWLSTMANSYEKYRIMGMTFHYIPNSSSATPGSVWMYPDYDVQRPPMLNALQYLNTFDAVEGSVWTKKTMPIRATQFAQTQKGTYLIRSPYETYTDYLLYDPVNVYLGTSASGDGTNMIGKLYVEYDVELLIPDPESQLKLNSCFYTFYNCSSIPTPIGGQNMISPITSTDIRQTSGNMTVEPLGDFGLVLSDYFCGYVTVYYGGAGYDAGRRPSMTVDKGTVTQILAVESEAWGGTDFWAQTFTLQTTAPNAIISLTGPLTAGITDHDQVFYLTMGSANPRFLTSVQSSNVIIPFSSRLTKKAPVIEDNRKVDDEDLMEKLKRLVLSPQYSSTVPLTKYKY